MRRCTTLRGLNQRKRAMPKVNRRDFLKGASAAVATAPLLAQAEAGAPGATVVGAGEEVEVRLNLNGKSTSLRVMSTTPLVEAIREGAGLTGTKQGCGHGACGACTVELEGQ